MSETIELDDLAADAATVNESKKQVSKATLADAKALAERQSLLELELEALEAGVDTKKKELRQVREEQLPAMLTDIGLKALTLSDGSIIEVKDNIYASIDDTNREQAHGWLRANNFEDLIKNTVVVTFGKGEDEYAEKLVNNINTMAENHSLKFGTIDQKEQVHASTLRAFVVERLESGEPFPTEIFKVFEGKITKLKRPKVSSR